MPNASLIRRLAAIVYDFLLIIALWLFTGSLLFALFGDSAPADGRIPEQSAIPTIWLQLVCYLEVFLFYFYFWRLRGQSLGMQVWKIKLVNQDDETVTSGQALLRFAAATFSMLPFGLGLLWMLLDPKRLALHDRISATQVIYLGSKPYRSEKLPADSG